MSAEWAIFWAISVIGVGVFFGLARIAIRLAALENAVEGLKTRN